MAWELLLALAGTRRSSIARVVDPAAGEGVFLEAAATAMGPRARLLGVDTDPALTRRWRSLAGKCPRAAFRVANGLINSRDRPAFSDARFHFVVGNPPFGGEGLRNSIPGGPMARSTMRRASRRDALLKSLFQNFQNWTGPRFDRVKLLESWRKWEQQGGTPDALLLRALERLRRYPIEALFLERFVRLARPGGWIAIIVPEGLLANDRHLHVREWVMSFADLKAVVDMPCGTFWAARTTARTSLLILRRRPASPGGGRRTRVRVLFACPDYASSPPVAEDYFGHVVSAARGSPSVADCCRWIASPRVRPNRWHAAAWHPRWRVVRPNTFGLPVRPLGDFIETITYGPILPGRRIQEFPSRGGVHVIGQSAVQHSGIDWQKARRTTRNSPFDPERSRPRPGDLLMPRSGVACLGRNRLAVYLGEHPANLSCFVDLVRLRGVNPFYVWLFLKTSYGFDQIRRLSNGVGTVNLCFNEIRSLRIPLAPSALQEALETRYRDEVLPLHRKGLAARSPEGRKAWHARAECAMASLSSWLIQALRGVRDARSRRLGRQT